MSSGVNQFLPHIDELVMEYLLYRGFTKTFKSFRSEKCIDRAKSFDVERIVSQLFDYIHSFDLENLMRLWEFLDNRFFSKLDTSYTTVVTRLGVSLKRCYLINAIQTGNRQKATDFFTQYGPELHSQCHAGSAEGTPWKDWFALPFIQAPDEDPYFKMYFKKEWMESFAVSLRNFLSVIFRNLPVPQILAFHLAKLEQQSLKMKVKIAESDSNSLRMQNAELTERIDEMKTAANKLYHRLHDVFNFSSSSGSSEALQRIFLEWQARFDIENQQAPGRNDPSPFSSSSASSTMEGTTPPQSSSFPTREIELKEMLKRIDSADSPHLAGKKQRSLSNTDRHSSVEDGCGEFKEQCVLVDHNAAVNCCKFSPPGDYLCTGGKDALITVYSCANIEKGRIEEISTVFSTASVISMGYIPPALTSSQHSEVLAYGATDGNIRLVNLVQSDEIATMKAPLSHHIVTSIQCSPCEPTFLTLQNAPVSRKESQSSATSLLEYWDYNQGAKIHSFSSECRINAIRLNKTGNVAALANADGTLELYDVRQNSCFMSWKASELEIHDVQFSANENTLYSIDEHGGIINWDLYGSGSGSTTASRASIRQNEPSKLLEYHKNSILYAPSSPFGQKSAVQRKIVLGEEDSFLVSNGLLYGKDAYVYQAGLPKIKRTLKGHQAPIVWLESHPTLPMYCTASEDQTVRIWHRK